MTIKDLLQGQHALTQLTILQRADQRFSRRFEGCACGFYGPTTLLGRYFGGTLTDDDVKALTDGLNLKT